MPHYVVSNGDMNCILFSAPAIRLFFLVLLHSLSLEQLQVLGAELLQQVRLVLQQLLELKLLLELLVHHIWILLHHDGIHHVRLLELS